MALTIVRGVEDGKCDTSFIICSFVIHIYFLFPQTGKKRVDHEFYKGDHLSHLLYLCGDCIGYQASGNWIGLFYGDYATNCYYFLVVSHSENYVIRS